MHRVIIASGNRGKLREIKAILSPAGIRLTDLLELGFNEPIEESGNTFEENALDLSESGPRRPLGGQTMICLNSLLLLLLCYGSVFTAS